MILNVSAFCHDLGTCVIRDEPMLPQCQGERFSRKKRYPDVARVPERHGAEGAEDTGA